MKPLLCLLFCCSFTLLAQQQWPEADCVKTEKKLQQLEQKISSGYSLKEAEQLSLAFLLQLPHGTEWAFM